MVTVLNNSESGSQILSSNLQKTIHSIREIVGNHSDSDIYNALKECNMDPNETAQKLLHQDPFHEVRRRRDKKKENAGFNSYIEPRKQGADYVSQGSRFYGSDRNARRGGYARAPVRDAGISREFRVVRDNRVNQNSDREMEASSQVSSSVSVRQANASEKSLSASSYNRRHFGGRNMQSLNGVTDFRPKPARDMNFIVRKEHPDQRRSAVAVSSSQDSMAKPRYSQSSQSSGNQHASSNAVGVYASASDPVHVPSPDSRSSAGIGVVGGRRHSSDSSSKHPFQQSISHLKSVQGASSNSESFRSVNSISGTDHGHSTVVESDVMSTARSRLVNQFGGRSYPQPAGGHHKGLLPSKEWKPKTSQKMNVSSPGVIGSPVKSASKPADDSDNVDREVDKLERKLSQVNIRESENVIIAEHIRVPENNRCKLMFGSFGMESDDTENSTSRFAAPDTVGKPQEPSPSGEQIGTVDDQVRRGGASTPSSGAESESQLPDKKHSSGDSSYTGMGLVPSSPLTASKSHQRQEAAEMANLSVYDSQPVYDMPYFRPSMDDSVRGPGLPSSQEGLSSNAGNSIPASSSVAVLQQQAQVAQMYPQVHLSHFANVMPYRQYIPPVYVSPMVAAGYSGNPGYPHLSNGSSYVLMPGGSSHLSASNLKYGVQQFKPLPGSSPTGFGNFVNPTGYTMNAPGVVGGPTGTDESSRLKYNKDSNLYVPNPQAETSEVWMQNQRELGGMQSTPYFNMQGGQTGHPAAYLPSHTSYNGAAQSSHMQFPGMLYPPPPQPAAHHSMGVGAPPAQVATYQQPSQIGHFNWTTNF